MFLSLDSALKKTNAITKKIKSNDLTKINPTDMISFLDPSLGFSFKNLSAFTKYVKPFNTVKGIISTLSVSKDSTLQVFDDKNITDIKLSDVLASTVTPIATSLNNFLSTFSVIGVNQKHISGFITNTLKLFGMNNATVDKIMQQLGYVTEKERTIFTRLTEKIAPALDIIKIGFDFTVTKIRDVTDWIKEKVDYFYQSFFQLSPKEIFQSFLLPLFPPFVTDIASRVATYFKEVFLSGARLLSKFVGKFFITPAMSLFNTLKSKFFKPKEEKSILEELIPKKIYETLKYSEELANAIGIKINPLTKAGIAASLIATNKSKSLFSKDNDKDNKGTPPKQTFFDNIKNMFGNQSTGISETSKQLNVSTQIMQDNNQYLTNNLENTKKDIKEATNGEEKNTQEVPNVCCTTLQKQQKENNSNLEEIKKDIKQRNYDTEKEKELQKRLVEAINEKNAEEIKNIYTTLQEQQKENTGVLQGIEETFNNAKINEQLQKRLLQNFNEKNIEELTKTTSEKIQEQQKENDTNLQNIKEDIKEVKERVSILANLMSKLSGVSSSFLAFSNKLFSKNLQAIETFKTAENSSKVSKEISSNIASSANILNNTSTKLTSNFKQISNVASNISGQKSNETIQSPPKVSIASRIVSFLKDKLISKDSLFSKMLDKTKNITKAIFGSITKIFTLMITPLTLLMNKLGVTSLLKTFTQLFGIKGTNNLMLPFFTSLLSFKLLDNLIFSGNLTKTITQFITTFFSNMWDKISNMFGLIGEELSLIFEKLGITTLWDNITGFIKNVWNNVTSWFSGFEGIGNAFKTIANSLKRFVDVIKNLISSATEFFSNIVDSISPQYRSDYDYDQPMTDKESIFNLSKFTSLFKKDSIASEAERIINATNENNVKNVMNAIIMASSKTGVPLQTLLGMAYLESSFNPQAKAQGSSAKGLYQFTDTTWKTLEGTIKNSGFSGNVFDPYSNALGAALYMSGSNYGNYPTLVYIHHFLPALTEMIFNTIKNKKTFLPVYALLRRIYDNDSKIKNVIDTNKSLFPYGDKTTVEQFIMAINQKLQNGILIGTELMKKVGYGNITSKISIPEAKQITYLPSDVVPKTISLKDDKANLTEKKSANTKTPTSVLPKPRNVIESVGLNNLNIFVVEAKNFIENNISWQLLDISYRKA